MSRFLKRTPSKRAEPQPATSQAQEPFTIQITIQAKDGLTCKVPAILDTGCPVDLVSLWFARRYLCERDDGEIDEGQGEEGKGEKDEREDGKRKKNKKRQEIHGAKAPRAKLTTSGEWCVPITTTCSQGKAISFTSFCAGIERDSRMPPVVLGMTTLEAQNINLAPRLQSWSQPCTPLRFIPERIGVVPSYSFVAENSFFDGEEKMPLRVILDTGTITNGVSIDFAKEHLSQVKSAPKSTWIDAEGKEHPCDGLWKLPLRLRDNNDKERSFTTLCWGMDLGEPSSGEHHSVRLSIATLVEQDIHLDCRTWGFSFGEEATKSQKNWTLRLVRSGIEKAKALSEKIREPKIDKE